MDSERKAADDYMAIIAEMLKELGKSGSTHLNEGGEGEGDIQFFLKLQAGQKGQAEMDYLYQSHIRLFLQTLNHFAHLQCELNIFI